MKKILLTGSSGFIGKNILESYLAQKYEIVAPKRTELNLTEENSVKEFFKDKEFYALIHSAAKPAHRNTPYNSDSHKINMEIFENLAKHKNKYEKFINLGSGAIYNLSKNIIYAEEKDILKAPPQDEFSLLKFNMYKKIIELEGFIDLNIFGIFGRYEDYSIRFISNAICKTLFDLPITLKQDRNFSYLFIEDLMPILEFFIENTAEYKSYNIVPDEKIRLLEIAEYIKILSGKNIDIIIKKDAMGLDYTGSNKRLKQEYKEVKFTDIKNSAERLYNWYKDNKNSLDVNLLLTDK